MRPRCWGEDPLGNRIEGEDRGYLRVWLIPDLCGIRGLGMLRTRLGCVETWC